MELFFDGVVTSDVAWEKVQSALEKLKQENSVLYLEVEVMPKSGPWRLDIRSSDDGYYSIMLAEVDRQGPRIYRNPKTVGKIVEIGGYDIIDDSLTQDFELVKRVVKEFFETGDVSKDILW